MPSHCNYIISKSIIQLKLVVNILGQNKSRLLFFTDYFFATFCSDASDLREPEKVRASQEKALQALQHYTLAHYPDIPSKFGELLLRIPDLQRTCQVHLKQI